VYRFGGIERLVLRFCDNHRHGFSDVAHFVGGQEQVRSDEDLAAARTMKLHIELGFWQWVMRDGPELVGQAIFAGEDTEDARHFFRGGGVDTRDACVCVR
jgi:hypothetical protein